MASQSAAGPAAAAQGKPQPAAGTASGTSLDQISADEFFRADIRVGLVLRAEAFPEARNPSYKLWIDFGELGTRASSAQLTKLYEPIDLVGRLVIAVVNFPPRRIAGFSSEVLVLGVPVGGRSTVALIQPDRQVAPGTQIF
ncbi:MAG TPA: tRNA-binding protein [Streptosporangiaceae bacterium]